MPSWRQGMSRWGCATFSRRYFSSVARPQTPRSFELRALPLKTIWRMRPLARLAVVDGDVEEDLLVLPRLETEGGKGQRGFQSIAFAVEIGQHDASGRGTASARCRNRRSSPPDLAAANEHLAVGILQRPAFGKVLVPYEQLDGVAVPDLFGLLGVLQRRGIGDLDEQVEVGVVPGEPEGGVKTLGVAPLDQAVGADPQGREPTATVLASHRA